MGQGKESNSQLPHPQLNIAIVVLEAERDVFVLGEILTLSTTYLPFNTTLEVVLNKPLITKDDNAMGFTIGLIKEI